MKFSKKKTKIYINPAPNEIEQLQRSIDNIEQHKNQPNIFIN